MQKHTRNYLDAMGYDPDDFIPCELCQQKSVDIHHVVSRSHFGSKNKDAQDNPDNLVALCRQCHDIAHGPESRAFREQLKEIILKRASELKKTKA
jgi:5-methylcytosine-specific restriction endonuclease McrA